MRSAIFGCTFDVCGCCFTGNEFVTRLLAWVGVSFWGSCWRWTWAEDDCCTGATDTGATDDVVFTC